MAGAAVPRTRRRHERREGDPRRARRATSRPRRRRRSRWRRRIRAGPSRIRRRGGRRRIALDRDGAGAKRRRARRRDRDLGADALVGLPRPRRARSIRPALLWCDGRTTAECARDHERASAARSGCATGVAIRRSRGSRCPRCSGCATTSRTRSRVLATVLLAEGLHPLPPNGSARHRAVGRVGDADVRSRRSCAGATRSCAPSSVPRALLPDVGRLGGGARHA